mgnify:CR=1 FL=1
MVQNMMNNTYSRSIDVSKYFKLTYLYMVLGIVTTGIGSVIGGLFLEPLMVQLFQSNIAWIGLIVVQFALIFVVARLAESQNKAIALSGYLGFTVFEGLIISPLLLFTDPKTLLAAFVSTAGLFGIMAMLGYATKIDMSRFGGILLAATFALLLAMIINMFIGSGVFGYIVSIIAVIVFAIWTAYDNQKLRISFESADETNANSIAVMGAFDLYLDFLNMFINLVRIFSNNN